MAALGVLRATALAEMLTYIAAEQGAVAATRLGLQNREHSPMPQWNKFCGSSPPVGRRALDLLVLAPCHFRDGPNFIH